MWAPVNIEKVYNYLCGYGEAGTLDAFAQRVTADQNKTTTYLCRKAENPVFSTNAPNSSAHHGRLYYFKDPETGLYQGPLSAIPTSFELNIGYSNQIISNLFQI